MLFISTGNGWVNFLLRFLTFFLHCLQCCCFRLSTTLGFVGFEFYSVFPGQSKYVHNSSLDGDLESWILTDHIYMAAFGWTVVSSSFIVWLVRVYHVMNFFLIYYTRRKVFYKIQSTPDNSNLQGKSKKFRVIGNAKK